MTQRYIYIIIIALFIGSSASAQVTVDAKIDSTQIFIGQRVGVTLEVSAEKGNTVEMPQFDSLQQIAPGVEVMHVTDVDTQLLNEGQRMLLSRRYILTSFDSALYYLPPMQVKVNDKDYESQSLALKVYSLDIDTLHADSIFGMKPAMSPPFVWEDWSTPLWISVIILILTALLLYIIIRLKDNKPIIRRIKIKPKLAPHKAAMLKIEHIKAEKIWQKEDSKEYYTELTDTLRQYINERYGFNAMEMTTPEIIEHLQEVNDEDALHELRELFQTADLVKFAKYSTLLGENDRNLVSAIEYINATKKEEPVTPQPTEIVVVEKRSQNTKKILIASVVVASIALLAGTAYLIYRIIMLNL